MARKKPTGRATAARSRPWWDRPAWGAAMAALFAVAALAGAGAGLQNLRAGRALDSAFASGDYCARQGERECVVRVPGVLGEPHDQYREKAERWTVRPDDDSELDGFEVGESADKTMARYVGQAVVALTYDGEVVGVELESGVVAREESVGPDGAATRFALAAACAALAVALLGWAIGERVRRRSWWSRGPAKQDDPVPAGARWAKRFGWGVFAVTVPGWLIGYSPASVLLVMAIAAVVAAGVLGYRRFNMKISQAARPS